MEEVEGPSALLPKKSPPTLTPKAIIHQKFGDKACYKVEELIDPPQNGCPGLAIPQKGPCLYRCCLQLPDFSVISDACKRKKEAEQSAAKMALDKLGLSATNHNPSEMDPLEDLVSRLSYLFSPEFLSANQPLAGHFRAALHREGNLCGLVPVSVIASYDAKVNNLCKSINPEGETNPLLVMSLILREGSKLPGFVSSSEEKYSLKKGNPHPLEKMQSVIDKQESSLEIIQIEAVRIPHSPDKAIETLNLSVPLNGYYLDIIAVALGLEDASKILISRPIGKASSETRMYFSVPQSAIWDQSLGIVHTKEADLEGNFNVRGSYLSGSNVCGDAIMASIGYIWRDTNLFHENMSVKRYYRLLIGKNPSGVYKLSREAILAAELPKIFTTRTSWRGSFPRDLLCTFCRQHRFSEPLFSTISNPQESNGSCKKLKHGESDNTEISAIPVGTMESFRCEVKIFSKSQELILEYSPKESYKKSNDAMQNAALKVLLWLDKYFTEKEVTMEELTTFGDSIGIHFNPHVVSKEFTLVGSICCFDESSKSGKFFNSNSFDLLSVQRDGTKCLVDNEGSDFGVLPSYGSLVCITYIVNLVGEEECEKEPLESCEEFEFEIGIGAVLPSIEAVVSQLSVGQSACFHVELPPTELILATAANSDRIMSLLSAGRCKLEYSTTLLRLTEPLEERMEQALFSPPLSKQRVEFALQYIKGSVATSLVDFGCGSGSLLDSLLDHSTSLETVVGVDLSKKGLARAAKILHSKLSKNLAGAGIKTALLYDGSIIEFDSRLYGFDIGTCLEVIEHMEEDQACLFGDIVLDSFCPRILIVSTPNYEYNTILHKSNLQGQEDDADEKNPSQSCKFRNDDHKFEWTREQFSHWATELAKRHNYKVEFSGVGGNGEVDPGFASQIAVFERVEDVPNRDDDDDDVATHIYQVVWEWSDI
ncbi:small RNA 2'-O-methyltransferase-like [Impatiens glandulifera]|uniref:small RNA 2'-O-methyltransferase-like n=1 Tax=Impatiens glandulifera TaxID=253017 RepID=UPI001FB075BA|nr:small RNA 2'-O-methyltransferase-like [Impatiens glandulifera]